MSANQKKALAVLFLFLFVTIVAFICGFAMSSMGSTKVQSVVSGAGAWAILMAIGVPCIALFDFTDTRRPPATPPVQNPPGTPGA